MASRRATNTAEEIQSVLDALKSLKALRHRRVLDPDHVNEMHDAAIKTVRKLSARFDKLKKDLDRARLEALDEDPEEKPLLESTTLWDFPTQSYGSMKKGDSKYQGVTPAFIIYNMVQRYTEPGDLVLDPMCGSGTTLDVCAEEGREAIGYDITPTRDDIQRVDARQIPLPDNSVDMVFIDSPYGDNVNYSDDPQNIGHLSAEQDGFYEALGQVAEELYRVLKPGKVLGWLIGDQWVKKRYTPVGMYIYELLTDGTGFIPVDKIVVARRNQSSNTGIWHYRARKHNFYLRGHKDLILVRKPETREIQIQPEQIIQIGKDANTRQGERRSWRKYK